MAEILAPLCNITQGYYVITQQHKVNFIQITQHINCTVYVQTLYRSSKLMQLSVRAKQQR